MKSSTFSFPVIFLSLVLAAVSVPGAVSGQQVVDTSGNPVRSGVPYYIIPARAGTGGGLVPSSREFNVENLCPLDVVQSPFPFIPGLPVTFTPNSPEDNVPLNGGIDIEFNSGVWLCPESKVWIVAESTQLGMKVVSTGGPGKLGQIRFQIVRDGVDYKIQHCVAKAACNDVGVFTDNLGVRHLVLGGEPFTVKFQKVYEANKWFEKTMIGMLPLY